jgi:predicted RNA-binding protein
LRLFELSKKERDVIEKKIKKSVEKTTFFEKTLEQNLTQILIFHIFKMTEKTCFFQLTGFLGDVIAEKHTFFRPLTSSLIVVSHT